jgi:hypothetical protein
MEQDTVDDDNIITSEAANYNPKSEFSKARVTEQALNICMAKRSKEMIKGYWNTKVTKEGMPIKTWIPDARKEFISSVKALLSLLSPEIIKGIDFDKKLNRDRLYYKTRIGELLKKEGELFDKYSYAEQAMIVENNSYKWTKTDNKYIPDVDESIVMPDARNPKMGKSIIGYWNQKVNLYWNEMLILYDKIFSELNCLIHDLDYFAEQLNWG